MAQQLWTEEADRVVLDSAPDSRLFWILCFGGTAMWLWFKPPAPSQEQPFPAWLFPLGPAILALIWETRRDHHEFSAQGYQVRTTTLGRGSTRSFEAAQIRGLRLEPKHDPRALVFEDRKTGDIVSVAPLDGGRGPELIELQAKVAERFPAYAEPAEPLPFSSRYRLSEHDSGIVLTLQGGAPVLVGLRLCLLALCVSELAVEGVTGLGASLHISALATVVGLMIGFTFVKDSRRERVVFDADGCTLTSKFLSLGRARHFAAERISGLRLEGTVPPATWCYTLGSPQQNRAASIVFDDLKTGRMVSFGGDLAWDAALQRVYAALVGRFADYAKPALSLPLSARMHLTRQPELLQFRFGWGYRVRLEMTPTALRYRDFESPLGGPEEVETVQRDDVIAIRLAPGDDWRRTTIHGPKVFRGVELLWQAEAPTLSTLLVAADIDETESRALLTRMWEFWPETECSDLLLSLRLKSCLAGPQSGIEAAQAEFAKVPRWISLFPKVDTPWLEASLMASKVAELSALGFAEVGAYGVKPLDGIALSALVNVELRLSAVVYEHTVAGIWTDVVAHYPDGSSFTVTSMRQGGLDERPGHPILHMAGADAATLLERMASGRPAGALIEVDADSFVKRFEQSYEESVDWREGRGGLTPDELLATAQSMETE